MHKQESKITCPLFNRQEPAINRITGEINKAREAQEKASWAEELLEEVGVLIACPKHDGGKPDCVNCRTICELRNRTATLVLKAVKLA
jgi:hypothetical protein